MNGEKRLVILRDQSTRRRAHEAIDQAPVGYAMRLTPPTRSLEQNAAQWPILEAFSNQLEWPVNGAMCKLEPEEWKEILTAAFRQETARLAMGLNGGVIMLGARTSKMSTKEFSEWLEFLHYIAAERGINTAA